MIKYHTTPNIIDIHIKYVLCISAFQPFYCCPLYLRFSAILIAIHLITVNITFLLRANQYVRIDREYNILRRIYSLQLLSSLLWWCVVFIVVVCGVGWCLLWWGVVFGGVGCLSARTETANAKGFGMRLYGVDDEIDGTMRPQITTLTHDIHYIQSHKPRPFSIPSSSRLWWSRKLFPEMPATTLRVASGNDVIPTQQGSGFP